MEATSPYQPWYPMIAALNVHGNARVEALTVTPVAFYYPWRVAGQIGRATQPRGNVRENHGNGCET